MIKILILEDRGLIRAGMRELIHICEPDAQIFESNSFEDAIQKMTEHYFDIALNEYRRGHHPKGLRSQTVSHI